MRRRIAIGLAVAAGLLAVCAAVLPGVLARSAARRLSDSLGTPVQLGWLSWNPLSGTWVLRRVRVAAERGSPAFAARAVSARVHLWDLVRGRQRIRLLSLEGARLRLRATPSGWELPLPPSPPGGAAALPNLDIDWAAAPRAVIRLEPRAGVRSGLRMRQLELTGALGPDGVRATVWTRGRLDRGSVAFVGRLRTGATASRRVKLRLAASGLDIARTLQLARASTIQDVRGRLDLHAKYDEAGPPENISRRVTGSGRVRDLKLRAHRVDGVWIGDLGISRVEADLGRQVIALGPVAIRGAEVWARRSGSTFTIAGLVGEEAPSREPPAWVVTMASANATNATVHVLDAEGGGAASLDFVVDEARLGRIGAENVAAPFSFSAGIGSGGRLSAEGDFVRSPLAATVRGRIDRLVLGPLLELVGTPVRLESGEAAGTFEIAFREGALAASADTTLADLKTVSPDDKHPEDVLAFKSARIRLRRATTEPPGAEFDAIEIDWPYVLVDRHPEGIFPLYVVTSGASSAPTTLPGVRIGALRVIGGRIDFRDTTLAPPYWRALANLRLDARAIEAPGVRIAEVKASGLVDELSPLQVSGTVGSRTRLVAEVERLALPPFNVYLQGTWPYLVSSGLLSGRSEVVLDRSELEVNNRIVLSRLGLAGGRGKDFLQQEVGVPLTLALALMKDYRGNIELDLPFGGNVRQPSFELRSVILQAIVRAVRGAVLSPLTALGRVILRDGRVEQIELDPIPFSAGARVLDAAGRERVAQVARVLLAHPEMAIRLRGVVAEADVERLRDEAALASLTPAPGTDALRAFLRARLEGQPPPTLSDDERARLEALLAAQPWPSEELQAIAVDRGAVSTASLILDHHLDPERVAAEQPEPPAPERLAAAPGALVALAER